VSGAIDFERSIGTSDSLENSMYRLQATLMAKLRFTALRRVLKAILCGRFTFKCETSPGWEITEYFFRFEVYDNFHLLI
jgi:hypothetical protein